MAITWKITITPIDVLRKEASIIAVRVDDTLGKTQTFHIDTAILDTVAQKTNALNQIWQMHLDEEVKQIAVAVYIGTLETDAKTNLETRE